MCVCVGGGCYTSPLYVIYWGFEDETTCWREETTMRPQVAADGGLALGLMWFLSCVSPGVVQVLCREAESARQQGSGVSSGVKDHLSSSASSHFVPVVVVSAMSC